MRRTISVWVAAAIVAAVFAFASPVSAATAVNPTTNGTFKAKSGSYRFKAKVDKLVTGSTATEIWAKLWYPSGKAFTKAPIAILLHGNHGTCGRKVSGFRVDDRTDYSSTGKCPNGYVVTPNHLGYDYVAKRLATNGFVVVSINVNRGINALADDPNEPNDSGLILRRGRMILRHLMLLGQWNKNGGQPGSIGFNLQGKLDFSRVTLFGHSRGGDAVVAAYNIFKTSSAWRKRLPSNTKFVAVAPLAPTDFQLSTPMVRGARLSVLLPMCDGDVNRLSGIGFYDRSVFGNQTDTAHNLKSVFAVWGTNHNGYNTEWQTEDQYQASERSCPGQNPIFPFPLGLSPKQQTIGTYFLMAVARGSSQSAKFLQMFNPAFTLPAPLTKLTRYDRSYFAGNGSKAKRLLRFDGTCSQKFSITTGVQGNCFLPPEHDVNVRVGRVRWNNTGRATNFAIFTINNGTAANLTNYRTLDMRVGPDCFLVNNNNPDFYGCTNISPNEAGIGSQNVFVLLRDSNNNFSAQVPLSSFVERRRAVATYFPGIVPINDNLVLAHAILSSARIPMSKFAKSGFNLAKVKAIYISLGNGTSKGGLYFGDVWAGAAKAGTIQNIPDEADEPAQTSDSEADADVSEITVAAVAAPPPPPATLPLHPATDGVASDATGPAAQAPALAASADPGTSIASARRSTLQVASGDPTADQNPEAPATRSVAAVELMLQTPQPVADTSNAGLAVTIGKRRVPARVFSTDSPNVLKVVIPLQALANIPDGAPIAVASPHRTWQFGPFNRSSIR